MPNLQDRLRDKAPRQGWNLFVVFARYEFAMKRGGFRKTRHAAAAWRTFADAVPQDFFKKMSSAHETSVIFDTSPKSLVRLGERDAQWMNNPATPTNVEQILGCVETIRNNLVHGDKNTDNQRDNDLLESALFILNALYDEIPPLPQLANFVSQFENLNAPVFP
jgi:hypothetical protein